MDEVRVHGENIPVLTKKSVLIFQIPLDQRTRYVMKCQL